ncbi:DUF6214 family protein [Streptomyces lunalinharesii]|uniref:Uncharacterized protein n=1 Tax=Streptomyces lunalinharesii TaxID=333384 RepID=A0ABP6DI28_9ACTN
MEWPDWELQAHGSAASELGPWFSARLTFPHGARVDVLVTVTAERLTVEDVRADPPLTLDALASLAHWIEGPLDDACRAATGRPPKDRPGAVAPSGPEPAPAPRACGQETSPARPREPRAGTAPPRGQVVHGAGRLCGSGAGPAPGTSATGPAGAPAATPTGIAGARAVTPRGGTSDSVSAPAPDAAPEPDPAAPAPVDGPAAQEPDAAPPAARSAVLVRSRAGERRKIAAAAYREAQQEGRDPVVAVMHATGRNRRRALRLIAGARDAGLLTPRHNKR